jgi:hypothetical protein
MIKKIILFIIILLLIPCFVHGQDTTKYVTPYILNHTDTLSVDTTYVIKDSRNRIKKIIIKKPSYEEYQEASFYYDPWDKWQNNNIKKFLYFLAGFIFYNSIK